MRRAALLGLLALAGCAPRFERWAYRPEGPPPPQGLRQLETRSPLTGRLERAWSVRYEADGRAVREGLEQLWWPDGTLRAERRWRAGEPEGLWRSWYRNGRLEMEHAHGAQPALQTFFHVEGGVRAMGPALRGVKEGDWSHFRADGSLEKQGRYQGGSKVGVWTLYHPSLGLAARGRFEADRRVGEWRTWPAEPVVWSDPFWPEAPRGAEDLPEVEEPGAPGDSEDASGAVRKASSPRETRPSDPAG